MNDGGQILSGHDLSPSCLNVEVSDSVPTPINGVTVIWSQLENARTLVNVTKRHTQVS